MIGHTAPLSAQLVEDGYTDGPPLNYLSPVMADTRLAMGLCLCSAYGPSVSLQALEGISGAGLD